MLESEETKLKWLKNCIYVLKFKNVWFCINASGTYGHDDAETAL